MADQTILNRAALILRKVSAESPADSVLRSEFSFHKNWSAAERRALVRAVFAYFRWFQWVPMKVPFQAQVEEALRIQDRFDKGETNIKVEALKARAVPAWLAAEMELAPEFLRQIQRDPVLWLRVRAGQEDKVVEGLGDCERGTVEPFGDGRVYPTISYKGTRDLYRAPGFQDGLFEMQDLSSQAVGWFCEPKAGETWWDTCAGEGGKTLHLADQMQGKGLIWASDRSEKRLKMLEKRTARAGVYNYRHAQWEGDEKLPTKTMFDGILIDAPCSGVGTWQRNPHARWSTQETDVAELSQVQKRLLTHASAGLRVGGRLVYSVCTLTRSETTGVVEAFARTHPNFILQQTHTLVPGKINANGMFMASWLRKE